MSIHQSWEDQNETSSFPFEDRATLLSTTRTVTIPRTAIRDMVLATPQLNQATRLAQVERTVSEVIVRFNQGNNVIGEAVVQSADDGWVQIIDDAGTPAGRMRIDRTAFATLFGLSIGIYRFVDAAATLVPWVTFYRPRRGFRGFRLPGGTVVTGEVTLIAGPGLEFEADGHLNVVGEPERNIPEDGLIPRAIRSVSADDGDTVTTVAPKYGTINGRSVGTGGRPPALMITNPANNVIRLEVTG